MKSYKHQTNSVSYSKQRDKTTGLNQDGYKLLIITFLGLILLITNQDVAAKGVVPINLDSSNIDVVKVTSVSLLGGLEPIKIDSVGVKPVAVPGITEPVKVDPVSVKPVAVPGIIEPVKVDPVTVKPVVVPGIIEPVKVDPVLAKPIIIPVVTEPVTPIVLNPQLLPIDINKDVTLPKTFNYDIASVIVEESLRPYLSINPDILKNSTPISYSDEMKYYQFDNKDQEGWFTLYVDGKYPIDIDVISRLDLQYDVINQEGASVPLNKDGGIDPGIVAGFYYIRVINVGDLGVDNAFGVETTVLYSQGGIVKGVVRSECDEQPIAGASVSIDTDFRFTHTDGSYEFLPKNPAEHRMSALATGYQSAQVVSQVQDLLSATANFKLTPEAGCINPDDQSAQEVQESKVGEFRNPVIYNEINGIVDLPDVYAPGLPDGDKHFRAQLTQIKGDDSLVFEITLLEEIKTENQNFSASYNYATSTLSIPIVQAFGKLFSVELVHTPDFMFSIASYSELK